MKRFIDFKEDIHKCSKCGLCQAVCPVYSSTKNDCNVSRGLFVMLNNVLKGRINFSKVVNEYLDTCLKCGACSKSCPCGIDVVDIIISAKHEYFKSHKKEQIISSLKQNLIYNKVPELSKFFTKQTKSIKSDTKVVYFGGCSSKLKGNHSVVKILNKLRTETITPDFDCCGFPLLMDGNIETFNNYIEKYINILKNYDVKEVITTCSSCEKALNDYIKWCEKDDYKEFLSKIKVISLYKYIEDKIPVLNLQLKIPCKITYHKPCNSNDYDSIKNILNNVKNLEYIEMNEFDTCCGFSAIENIKNYKILKNIAKNKRNNIINTGADYVLTSCPACEIALKTYSLKKYKTMDISEFFLKKLSY